MKRLTVAQALVQFLSVQEVERDGTRSKFFAGCFGIFGHGNVAGIGQALHQYRKQLPFHPARNEQAMVHIAAGYARQRNRLGTFACTTSVGPGATNMVTGAALATINRLPVLLLPGDTFATRTPHPVLQQLEVPYDATVSVNDCLRPVSRFYERVERAEQLIPAALEAMRVLTDPAETGAVTVAMPEDVQTEAFDVPDEFLERRVWTIYRQPAALEAMVAAEQLVRAAKRPLIVAGGGVIYSDATAALREFVDATGIPVCETQAGRGALVSDHQLSLGAVGATGTAAANRIARQADLVIGIGTRWSDFTTASRSAFQDPGVRFVNVNVASFDAAKQSGLSLVADARAALIALGELLNGWRVEPKWEMRATEEAEWWAGEVRRLVSLPPAPGSPPSQASIIGAINDAAGERGVVVCAAGSAPGDLHKLWRANDPDGKSYHVEYGYSCMGYEIPGGIGVKLAAPDRDVFVLIGDGSYLMLPGELVTAVAQRIPMVIVLVDNHGFASIGALSRSVGSDGFGTQLRDSNDNQLPLDLAANAASLGAEVMRVSNIDQLRGALDGASDVAYPVVIYIEADRDGGVLDSESWWDVPVAEVSDEPEVRAARERYEHARKSQRTYLATTDE
ncbi:MAG TPA: 3D-(3,5/4)-trihydroxycyclohexane-1,2-dione acylhydrolase (decyclizing) [Solirubrobacteraceae bacterium]|nr:3D-(3,5/4)-trihydroxycyclohexane-1,2-dione acylhydrolase (decyclizing) [Solirubrobacteraceae bacterium]